MNPSKVHAILARVQSSHNLSAKFLTQRFYFTCLFQILKRNIRGGVKWKLRSAIKIPNTARLSCKLTTVILMVLKVADR